jgi:hypothetical protein
MHEAVAAMEPPVANKIQQWQRIPAGQSLNLNSDGDQIDTTKLSKADQQLLKDYKLIQYDITAGKNYLKDLDFMELPNETAVAGGSYKTTASTTDAGAQAAADAASAKAKAAKKATSSSDSDSDSSDSSSDSSKK